jgi:hypothetical protein
MHCNELFLLHMDSEFNYLYFREKEYIVCSNLLSFFSFFLSLRRAKCMCACVCIYNENIHTHTRLEPVKSTQQFIPIRSVLKIPFDLIIGFRNVNSK